MLFGPLTAQEVQWYCESEDALGQDLRADLSAEEDETGITMADLYPDFYLSANAEGGVVIDWLQRHASKVGTFID